MMETQNHSKYLIGKSLALFVNPWSRTRYEKASSKIGDFILNQQSLLSSISKRTHLSFDELQDLIQTSATIMTFSSLMGWDFGSRVNKLEGIKAAAIGATIGLCLVIGHITFKIILRKKEEGFELGSVEIEETNEELDEQVAAYP